MYLRDTHLQFVAEPTEVTRLTSPWFPGLEECLRAAASAEFETRSHTFDVLRRFLLHGYPPYLGVRESQCQYRVSGETMFWGRWGSKPVRTWVRRAEAMQRALGSL